MITIKKLQIDQISALNYPVTDYMQLKINQRKP